MKHKVLHLAFRVSQLKEKLTFIHENPQPARLFKISLYATELKACFALMILTTALPKL